MPGASQLLDNFQGRRRSRQFVRRSSFDEGGSFTDGGTAPASSSQDLHTGSIGMIRIVNYLPDSSFDLTGAGDHQESNELLNAALL